MFLGDDQRSCEDPTSPDSDKNWDFCAKFLHQAVTPTLSLFHRLPILVLSSANTPFWDFDSSYKCFGNKFYYKPLMSHSFFQRGKWCFFLGPVVIRNSNKNRVKISGICGRVFRGPGHRSALRFRPYHGIYDNLRQLTFWLIEKLWSKSYPAYELSTDSHSMHDCLSDEEWLMIDDIDDRWSMDSPSLNSLNTTFSY